MSRGLARPSKAPGARATGPPSASRPATSTGSSRAIARLDPVDVAGLLAEGGPVARAPGAFEGRASPRDMAAYTGDAYNDGGVGLLEAGTGVGRAVDSLVAGES